LKSHKNDDEEKPATKKPQKMSYLKEKHEKKFPDVTLTDEQLAEKYDLNQVDSDDSSDEEVLLRNGNVPDKWYELYDHQGYGVKGQKVEKMAEKDQLEKFIEKQENPNSWWKNIVDKLNNKEVKLSKADLQMVRRVLKGQWAETSIDPFADFDYEVDPKNFIHPYNHDEPKRRF
jgi:ribosome biogenesis protein ERB1